MISRCQRILAEDKRAQGQSVNVMKISKTIATLAEDLARSHIDSHPELQALLDHNGALSFYTIKHPTPPTNSSRFGSQQTPLSTPDEPRSRRLPTLSESAAPFEIRAELPNQLPPVETHAHEENPTKPTIYVTLLDHASEFRPASGASEQSPASASSQSMPHRLRHQRLKSIQPHP